MSFVLPSPSNDPLSTSPELTPHTQAQKRFSCVLCAQRKVKCDKLPRGCSNCTKARVACVYKAPLPARRRKKGIRDVDIPTRLHVYEEALRKLGVDPESLMKQNGSITKAFHDNSDVKGIVDKSLPASSFSSQLAKDPGVLVLEEGKSRYLENGIWTSLQGELRDAKTILDDSSDEEATESVSASSPEPIPSDGSSLLFGSPKPTALLRPLHPQPVQMYKLWQKYLDNVNPLVRVLHVPTVQHILSDSSGNLDNIPKNVEALLFAIYCISAESLSNAGCEEIMGESKSAVTQRFRTGAQHALINAGLLKTSDMMVLQALSLFLLSLHNYDPRAIWILAGIAERIGRRIGLHRDGEILGLPPFETEMRRRIWWQVIMTEGFSEKLAGSSGSVFLAEVKMPSNLNDSDMFPGMKELPKEHEGPSDMMHFLIRCHGGEFLKRSTPQQSSFNGVWSRLSTRSVSTVEKDKAIDGLESIIQRKFLQFCDKSIPWHLLCYNLGKCIVLMMRFMSHQSNDRSELSESEKDRLFLISLQVNAYQNTVYTIKEMEGFLWHVRLHFQWKAFIWLVSELCHRTHGPQVEEAWNQVQQVYDFQTNFVKNLAKKAMPIAVGNLTLKAWEAHVARCGVPSAGEPYFIQLLRNRWTKKDDEETYQAQPGLSPLLRLNPKPLSCDVSNTSTGLSYQYSPLETLRTNSELTFSLDNSALDSNALDLNTSHMDWSSWDNLLADFDMSDYPNDLGTNAPEVLWR